MHEAKHELGYFSLVVADAKNATKFLFFFVKVAKFFFQLHFISPTEVLCEIVG